MNKDSVIDGLGWFSIGLGLAEILAPDGVAKLVGVKENKTLFRLLGARELITGIGILGQEKPTGWLRGRVAGDAMDMTFLGAAMAQPETKKGRAALAMAAMAGVTAVDVIYSQKLAGQKNIHVKRSVAIDRSAEELYQFWRNFEDLPRFMNHLKSVERVGDNLWHWVAKGPAGTTVEWDAEIINEHPNELIAWKSLPDANIENAGTVRFERAPGGRGTMVKIEIGYKPLAGALGAKVAKLFGEAPEQQIAVDLRRFKQLMETGEIARTEGQPAGRDKSVSTKYDEMVRT